MSPGRAVANGCVALLLAHGGVAGAQVWEVDDVLLELAEARQSADYGRAVAVGDFDGDTLPDIVVGAPGWSGVAGGPFGEGEEVSLAGRVEFWRNLGGRQFERVDFRNGGQGNEFFGQTIAMGDFDNDLDQEVAVAAPGRDVDGLSGAGVVRVYAWNGSSMSLVGTFDQNDAPGESPSAGDRFGSALVVGHFDDDAYADLAVGVPFESSSIASGGVVHVFYGSAAGLAVAGSQSWKPGAGGVTGTPNAFDYFGFALAAGDFNDDSFDDLAVGAPGRNFGETDAVGAVHVLRGSSGGIQYQSQRLLFHLSFAGLGGGLANDHMGAALAAGNFNQQTSICGVVNCYDDLAIGIPDADVSVPIGDPKLDAGEVVVAYGSSTGLSLTGVTVLDENDVAGSTPAINDQFGSALAAGRLDRPGVLTQTAYWDLAVGVPGVGTAPGAVQLFFGATGGLDAVKQEQTILQQAGFEIAPESSAVDRWGEVVVIADLDKDGWGDLVVGVGRKTRSGQAFSGAVQILWGGLFGDGFDTFNLTGWSNF